MYKEERYEKKLRRQAFQHLRQKEMRNAELKRKSRLEELGLVEETHETTTKAKKQTESLRPDIQKIEKEEAFQLQCEKETIEREELFCEEVSAFLYEQVYKNYFLYLDHGIDNEKKGKPPQLESMFSRCDAKLKLLLLAIVLRILTELRSFLPNVSNPSLEKLLEAMIPKTLSKETMLLPPLSSASTTYPTHGSILSLLPLVYNQKCTFFPAFQGLLFNHESKWKSMRLPRQSNLNTEEVERIMESLLPWRQSFCPSIFNDRKSLDERKNGATANQKLSNVLVLELWVANVRDTRRQAMLFHDLLNFINECTYTYVRAFRAALHLQTKSYSTLNDYSSTVTLEKAEFIEKLLLPQHRLVLGLKYFHYFLISWYPTVSSSSKILLFDDLLEGLTSENFWSSNMEDISKHSVDADKAENRSDFQINERLSSLSLNFDGGERKELKAEEDQRSQPVLASIEAMKMLDKSLSAFLLKLDFIDFVEDDLITTESLLQNNEEPETHRQSFHNELHTPKSYFASKIVQILSTLLSREQYQLSSFTENLESSLSDSAIISKFKNGEVYIGTISSTFLFGLRNVLLDSCSSKSNMNLPSSFLLSKLKYSQQVGENICKQV